MGPYKNLLGSGCDDDYEEYFIPEPVYPQVPTVEWTPSEIVATFYDLEGEPLLEIEAPRNPIGFA